MTSIRPQPTTAETQDEREKLLAQLDEHGRKLVEQIMADHPGLSAKDCIEHCREMGGL